MPDDGRNRTSSLRMFFLALLTIHGIFSVTSTHIPPFPLNESLLPEFLTVPGPLIPVSSDDYPVRIGCRAWPPSPFGRVTYFSAAISRSSSAPLHPLRADLLDENSSEIVIRTADSMRFLLSSELHCLASTTFGSVLSPPFRLTVNNSTDSTKTATEFVPEGRTAVVRCGHSHASLDTTVRFKVNGSTLDLIPGKHLIIPSVQTSYVVQFMLLIRGFDHLDTGLYECLTLGGSASSSKPAVLDSHKTYLYLKDVSPSYVEYSDFATINTEQSQSSISRIMVNEGWNISLRCPPDPNSPSFGPRITHDRRPAVSSRHHFDPIFGVLFIDQVFSEDSGIYRCQTASGVSSLFLHVKPKLNVQVYPSTVDPTTPKPLVVSCLGSEPFPPIWYHNGRVQFAQQQTRTANASIHLNGLTEATVGVYQCVQRSLSGGWTSDLVLVSNQSQKILRRSDFEHVPNPDFAVIRLAPTTLTASSGRTLTLGCWPENITSDQLSKFLPGNSERLSDRLRLALMLRFARVGWSKDGVPLQLPVDSMEQQPHHFNLTVTRSQDFGLYECVVNAPVPVLFYAVHVQSPDAINTNSESFLKVLPHYDASGLPLLYNESSTYGRSRTVVNSQPEDIQRSSLLGGGARSSASFLSVPKTQHMQMDIGPTNPRSLRPTAYPIGDNLAVNVTWPAVEVAFYQLQLRHKLPNDRRWTKPTTTDGIIHECCTHTPSCCQQTRHYYFTSRQPDILKPGHLYQFRVLLFMTTDATVPVGKSSWSSPPVSFEHIAPIAPVFTEAKRLPDGDVLARWKLSSSALEFPLDHFLLLYRMELQPLASGEIAYNPFEYALIPGGDTRECKLSNLDRDKGYQLVVYGVHTPPGLDSRLTVFQGGIGGRKITLFSHEVFVRPQTLTTTETNPVDLTENRARYLNTYSTAESNRLMFLILGALAGLMLLIMTGLIILCVCRQMRKNSQSNYTHKAIKPRNNSWLMERDQSDTGKFPPRSSTFMLEHLGKHPDSTLSSQQLTGNRRSNTGRTSLIYSQPPPFVAPPPPGDMRYLSQEQLTLLQQRQSMMMQSQLSDCHVPNNQLPLGMKREPPSGGSVHGGTDTENDGVDSAQPSGGHPLAITHSGSFQHLGNFSCVPNVSCPPAQNYFLQPTQYVGGQLTPQPCIYPADMFAYVPETGSLGYQPSVDQCGPSSANQLIDGQNSVDASMNWSGYKMYPISTIPEQSQHAFFAHPHASLDYSVNHRSSSSEQQLESADRPQGNHFAPGKRSRRRRLTAERSSEQNQPLMNPSATQILMAPSPECAPTMLVDQTGATYLSNSHMYQPFDGSAAAKNHSVEDCRQRYPMGHFNPAWTAYPQTLMSYSDSAQWTHAPDIPMHRHSLLHYGEQNPLSSAAVEQLSSGIGPPRVRHYSEYGIPDIRGAEQIVNQAPSDLTHQSYTKGNR